MLPRSILTESREIAHHASCDERSASQSRLISEFLATVSLESAAIETYELFSSYVDSLSPASRTRSSTVLSLEKFILWAICIAMKPLDEFTTSDLKEFLIFCSRPPETWVGAWKTRFVICNNSEAHNASWKPFRQAICCPDMGNVINRFFKYLSPVLGSQPMLSSSDLAPAPREPISDVDDYVALRYLEYLADLAPSNTRVLERSLFVFSVCYYLEFKFKELRAERVNFSMACFSAIGSDTPIFTMRGRLRDYNIAIPLALVVATIRYRQSLGLSPIPSVHEDDPIFTEGQVDKLMSRLPRMPGLGRSASKLLDRAISFRVAKIVEPSTFRISRSESARQYRLSWERKQILNGLGINRSEESLDTKSAYNTQERPSPLCGLSHNKVITLSEHQSLVYAATNFSKSRSELVLVSLGALRLYGALSADRLKLVAFEKLLLWSIYVKNKSFRSLTVLDAREFYEFCLSPPMSWTQNSSQRRFAFGEGEVVPNPNWTPFLKITELDNDMCLRAGRIIDWCENVYNSLIALEIVRINIFLNILN
ncbi:hypothetical protein PSCFBP3800_02918 [Pseudomonas syringae group genomosp. 3]|nr:hypothetical protein PSCFBP3800_02918 [Pseudomonas syringae group genomosp. 3]